MVEFLNRHRRTVVVLGLGVAALLAIGLPGSASGRAKGALGTIFAPAQMAVSRIGGAIASVTRPLVTSWRRGQRVEALEEKVARLRAENAQLLERQAALQRDLAEAIDLKRTLPAADLEFIAAPVIGRDSCTWSKTITVGHGWSSGVRHGQLVLGPTDRLIAAGHGDGVGEGDAVLSGARVVGRVAAVGPFHSIVRLVTDPSSVMRAQIIGRRDGRAVRLASGILKGAVAGGTTLRLEYVHQREDVRPGDVVHTAGYGAVLPAPLVVGRVEAVTASPMPLLNDVTVRPAVDLGALRRVVIVHERRRESQAGAAGGLSG